MDERFKRMTLRDDGFLEVILKRIKDFDDYIFQQMQKDGGCLPCVRDHTMKSRLYYDTKGYVSLRSYMKSYTFDQRESCTFLICVLEQMIQVNTTKPVYMDIDHIYVSYDGGMLRFVVIPVAVEQWVFQKEESRKFLQQIIGEIRIAQGYEAIGYLAYMQRFEEVTLPVILQGLHDLYDSTKPKVSFIEKLLHLHTEEPYAMKDVPIPKSYPVMPSVSQVMEQEAVYQEKADTGQGIRQETVVLLQRETKYCQLIDDEHHHSIDIDKDLFTIGRAADNDLCIREPHVSLYHACFHRSTHELEDLTSSNGTCVNDRRIQRCELHDQDIVCFARTVFRFQDETSA